MGVEGCEVGIVGHPLLFGPAVGDGAFQAIDGFIRLAQLGIDAAHVVENAGLLGFHHQRALGPFQGAIPFAELSQAAGPEINCPRVVRVELEVPLDELMSLRVRSHGVGAAL